MLLACTCSCFSHQRRPTGGTPLQPRPRPRPRHGLTSFINGQYAHARTHGSNACGSCLLAKSLVPTSRRLAAWPIVVAQTARYLSLFQPPRYERSCRSFHESRPGQGGRTCACYISRFVSVIPQPSCALPDVVEIMAGSSFPPDDPARMFRREYKWSRIVRTGDLVYLTGELHVNRSQLTKWESLPRLQLEPHRVVYDCSVCNFTNTIGLTCPWCMSLCRARVSGSPCARRRISCPQLLSEAQREQIRRLETRPAMTTRSNHAVSSKQPGREAARARVRPRVHTTRRQKHRKAGVHSTADIVATITYVRPLRWTLATH